LFAAEEIDDFNRRAERPDRVDFEDLERLDALEADVSVFVEQRFEHGVRLVAIPGEHIAFAHLLGPLTARERWLVECDMADEAKGVVVPTDLLSKFRSLSDADVDAAIDKIIAANPGKSYNALIGFAMKELRGKVPGNKVAERLKAKMPQ
jgi:hypothetical protein